MQKQVLQGQLNQRPDFADERRTSAGSFGKFGQWDILHGSYGCNLLEIAGKYFKSKKLDLEEPNLYFFEDIYLDTKDLSLYDEHIFLKIRKSGVFVNRTEYIIKHSVYKKDEDEFSTEEFVKLSVEECLDEIIKKPDLDNNRQIVTNIRANTSQLVKIAAIPVYRISLKKKNTEEYYFFDSSYMFGQWYSYFQIKKRREHTSPEMLTKLILEDEGDFLKPVCSKIFHYLNLKVLNTEKDGSQSKIDLTKLRSYPEHHDHSKNPFAQTSIFEQLYGESDDNCNFLCKVLLFQHDNQLKINYTFKEMRDTLLDVFGEKISEIGEFFFDDKKYCDVTSWEPEKIEGILKRRHRAVVELAGLCAEKSKTQWLRYHLLSLNFHFDGESVQYLNYGITSGMIDVKIIKPNAKGENVEEIEKEKAATWLFQKALMAGSENAFEEYIASEQFLGDNFGLDPDYL